MFYIGKYCDTFEFALSQLLTYAGCRQIPFLDCLSLRCFGFRTDGAIETWFQPFVSLPEAVSSLSEMLGVKMRCEVICSAEELPDYRHGILLGPLGHGVAVPELRDYYYHGNGRYLFIQRQPQGGMEVFDPHGFAGLFFPTERLDELLRSASTFCAWFPDLKPQANEIEPKDILVRGLAYHDCIAGEEMRQLERACSGYVDSQQSGISLQYGVLNLLQQMDKVSTLATLCGWKIEQPYLEEKQALFACGLGHTVIGLPEVVSRIWRSLDDR